jgi:uncharacterized membrane protein YeaQ/YmgE (transglycosylase-associated protein family)
MGIIAWIVVGLVVGGSANWIMKGGFGLIGSLVAGVIGAVIAGYVGNLVTGQSDGFSVSIVSLVFAIFFAILVVGFAKVMLGRGSDA